MSAFYNGIDSGICPYFNTKVDSHVVLRTTAVSLLLLPYFSPPVFHLSPFISHQLQLKTPATHTGPSRLKASASPGGLSRIPDPDY